MSNVLWSPFLGSKVACKMQSKRDEASFKFIKSKTFRHYSRIVYWIQRLELNKLESQAKVQQWHQIKSLCLLSNINWKKDKNKSTNFFKINTKPCLSLVYHLFWINECITVRKIIPCVSILETFILLTWKSIGQWVGWARRGRRGRPQWSRWWWIWKWWWPTKWRPSGW